MAGQTGVTDPAGWRRKKARREQSSVAGSPPGTLPTIARSRVAELR